MDYLKSKEKPFAISYEEQTKNPRSLVILREKTLVLQRYTVDIKAHFKTL